MKATRDGFGDALYQLVQENPDLVVLSADLSESVKVARIRQDFPDQYVECGICEQNMAGVAAGLAMLGKIPVITSFATFSPGRNWEQIRVAVCEQGLPVKIVGSHAGLATGADGATHQALEDIALMSVLPGMEIYTPCDYDEAKMCTKALINSDKPGYLRLSREPIEPVNQGNTQFAVGRGRRLREGDDAAIFTYGLTVPLSLQVADSLAADADLQISVVNLPTLCPLDTELILDLADSTQALITIEEHQVTGGLGSMVASLLATQQPTILEIVGVESRFGQSGTKDQLFAEYGLSVDALRDRVLQAIERKCEIPVTVGKK